MLIVVLAVDRLSRRAQQDQRAEDHRPHHLDDPAPLAPLPHRRVAQLRRDDPLGLGWPARPGAPRPGLLHAVDVADRRLIRGVLVGGDQQIGPAPGPVVDLADQPLAGRAVALAGHQGQEQPALGIDGGMVPVVAAEPIQGVQRVARRLLLGDEAPLLVDLDLTGRGGKGHELVVESLGVGPGEGRVARHGVLVDPDQAAGGARPAALAEVLQDGEGLLVGQSGLLQDGALALGEGALAGAAVDHADPPALAAPAAEVEVFAATDAGIGAVGILATQAFDGYHGGHPCS